jgi:hypothetical protein
MLNKLKSRTEWQAFLITVVVLAADHFLGLEVDPEKLWMLVVGSGSYGVSRGVAKLGRRPAKTIETITTTTHGVPATNGSGANP